jgi:hypothetical protein
MQNIGMEAPHPRQQMTVRDLAKLITARIIARALEQPTQSEAVDFFARASARFMAITTTPADQLDAELIKFGHEFGLLAPTKEA